MAFDSEVVADKMCQIHFHTISDKMVCAYEVLVLLLLMSLAVC